MSPQDETPSIPEEELPDHEVGWEERLRREVVRGHRFRWRRLERLMEEDRRRREDPAAAPADSDPPGGSPQDAEPETETP